MQLLQWRVRIFELACMVVLQGTVRLVCLEVAFCRVSVRGFASECCVRFAAAVPPLGAGMSALDLICYVGFWRVCFGTAVLVLF